jgi:hypothetical protein
MRIYLAATLTVAAVGLAAQTTTAFQPPVARTISNSVTASSSTRRGALFAVSANQEEETSSPCATPDGVIPESVTAQSLRSAILTNADGELVNLGEQMGKRTSVVVFLRHLG